MNSSKWLTIATVVKDDPTGFEQTLASIAEQALDGVEFLIVDSSENRDEIQNKLSGFPSIQYTYVWVAPAGIYAAMNHALSIATGESMYFLNAGDTFAAAEVLENVRPLVARADFTWGFGPVEILEVSGNRVITPAWNYQREKKRYFSAGHFPSHQGTITSTRALRDVGGFQESYRVAADYAAFLSLTCIADPIEFPLILAIFREGGTSTIQWRQSFSEFHHARMDILRLRGAKKVRESLETKKHFLLVYLNRELGLSKFRYRSENQI